MCTTRSPQVSSSKPQQQAKQASRAHETASSTWPARARGLVGYVRPSKPNYRTLEQKRTIRAIRAARTRWTRVGFYDVSHACVEPRLGATKIVPMTRQGGAIARRSSDTHSTLDAARFRRKLRMWRATSATAESNSNASVSKPTLRSDETNAAPAWRSARERTAYKATEQYKRAQARRVLQAAAATARRTHESDPSVKRSSAATREMAVYDMRKQLGRDAVTCRRRLHRVVTSFSASVEKERSAGQGESDGRTPTEPTGARRGPGLVPFSATTGRDAVRVDKAGIYLLGTETEATACAELDIDRADAALRPRVPAARITAPSADDERFPLTATAARAHAQQSVLEPAFDAVEPSVRGHRFVRFHKQLERPALVPSAGHDTEQLVLPSEFPALERLKYPIARAGVDYATMRGRENQHRHQQQRHHHVTLASVDEPQGDQLRARVPTAVDMRKMLGRSDFVATAATASPSYDMMCKLRANHDELERVMRLLSKHVRLDTGAVAMKRGASRFADDATRDRHEVIDDTNLDWSVLSTRKRSDLTLVAMKTQLGRADVTPTLTSAQTLLLSPRDNVLSQRKRSVALAAIRSQVARTEGASNQAETDIHQAATFMDPKRDSVTTRFLQRKQTQERA